VAARVNYRADSSALTNHDLTSETHGNANGIGLADFVPQRVLEKIDLEATYMNALTSTVTESVRLPLVMATDRDALEAAVVDVAHGHQLHARGIEFQGT
jgi:hypothetical protein